MDFANTKEIGNYGERVATRYLRRHGYRILARNWFAGKCELDIVASTLRDLVFVEVKTRSYSMSEYESAPPPSLAVHAEKQRLTRTAANQYRFEHPTTKTPRMDVVEVWLLRDPTKKRPRILKIKHMKAAY